MRKGEETKEKILRTAMEILAKQGIERTTTREIAKKAGISVGLVNYYFPSTDQIFLETVRFIFEDFKTKTREEAKKHEGVEKVLQALRTNYELFLDHPLHYRCFAASYAYAAIHKEFKELHTGIFQSFTKTLSEYLQECLPSDPPTRTYDDIHDLAVGILEELDGSLLFFYFTRHSVSKEEYTETHLRRFHNRILNFLGRKSG